MKNAIPRYNFYKTKYGSELLIDVVDLQYTRKFLTQGKVHILTYYDITFITEGEGEFTIGNRTHLAAPGDVFFSKPGEVRSWDTDRIGNGHALIFEDTFLTSFFKDPLFVQHLPFFRMGKTADKLQLPNGLYARILQLLHDIKVEIDSFHPHDTGILRALLYEVLMLLNRAYRTSTLRRRVRSHIKISAASTSADSSNWLGSTSGSSILYNSMPINYASLPTI